MVLTAFESSMVVNALVTSLIVFKIRKVFLGVMPTSVERTLGSMSPSEDTKLRRIILVVIESGMALFTIQLARVVITAILLEEAAHCGQESTGLIIALNLVIPIYQMFNVIIRSVHFYFFCFTDDIYLARESHQQ